MKSNVRLTGVEHHVPFLADLRPPFMGMPYMDHSLRPLVLHGVVPRPRILRGGSAHHSVYLRVAVERQGVAQARLHWDSGLLGAGTQEVEISIPSSGSTGWEDLGVLCLQFAVPT